MTNLIGGPPLPNILPQSTPAPVDDGGGSRFAPPQEDISPEIEQAMWVDIHRNIEALHNAGKLITPAVAEVVMYNFPLRLAPGLPDDEGFRVSAFADHDTDSGIDQVLDYNGGKRTYDGHRGTDYSLWPFPWNKLDAGEVQVVAAAAGTIVSSANVDSTDHNCISHSSDPWNYVALLHADGRMTLYGHMRYNSITSKAVGQTVAQGEVLGTAASSGDSSGPHLHFEARSGGFSNTEWFDPYSGPYSQSASRWADQRPYFDAAINKLSTHKSPPATPDPCQPDIPNLQDSFTTPARVYFYAFYRDFQGPLVTQLAIYRPDGSVYKSWQVVPTDNQFHSVWKSGWVNDFSAADPAGTWRFEAGYNGQVYETFFNLNAPPTITVTSPNGGEQWGRQQTHSITWTDNLGGDVNIALYHNGVYSTAIAYNTPSDGEYLWLPNITQELKPGYTIRVTSVLSPVVQDDSQAAFTLNNGALVARDETVMTLMNTPITIDVVRNDESPNSDPLVITALSQPMNGQVSLVNARIIYTPTPGFLGSDVFTYTVSTSTEHANATVTVLVAFEIFKLSLPQIRR